MSKYFTIIIGLFLILWGILGLFWDPVSLFPVNAIIFIVAGMAGLFFSRSKESAISFSHWLGWGALVLTVLGFLGFNNIADILNFEIAYSWIYLIITLSAFWVYYSEKEKLKINN